MAISIRVGGAVEPEAASEASEVPSVPIKFNLNMRRTLDNNIIISDHPDIDIVLMLGAEEKIVLFPKEVISDIVYDTQNRFFRFMRKKGIVNPETVRGGNVYGSLEGSVLGSAEQEQFLPLVILNISKFIDEERPYFEYVEKYKQMEDDEMLDPTAADSTELGEVPQAADKGGIRPGYGRVSPYFLSYML
tara:strand:- start:439 stop:1008 length:570 start_codon:yes stop_codon:yes gene_type:complete